MPALRGVGTYNEVLRLKELRLLSSQAGEYDAHRIDRGDARVNRRSALCGEPKRVQDAKAFTDLPWAEFMQSSSLADTETSSMVRTEHNEGIGVHRDNGFDQTFEMSINALQLVDKVAVAAAVVVSR